MHVCVCVICMCIGRGILLVCMHARMYAVPIGGCQVSCYITQSLEKELTELGVRLSVHKTQGACLSPPVPTPYYSSVSHQIVHW